MIPDHALARLESNHTHAVNELKKAQIRAAHIVAVANNNVHLAVIQLNCDHEGSRVSDECCGGRAMVCPQCGFSWI